MPPRSRQIGLHRWPWGAHPIVFLQSMFCFEGANQWLHGRWASTLFPLLLFWIGGGSLFNGLPGIDLLVWPIGGFPRPPRSYTSSLDARPTMDSYGSGWMVWRSCGWPSKAPMAVMIMVGLSVAIQPTLFPKASI